MICSEQACDQKAAPGSRRCEPCAKVAKERAQEKSRARSRAYYHGRRAAGLCARGGCKEVVWLGYYCEAHSEMGKEQYRARMAAGMCSTCSNPRLPDKTVCEACRQRVIEQSRKRNEERKSLGICFVTGCGLPRDGEHVACSGGHAVRAQ